MSPYRERYHKELDLLIKETKELAERVDLAIESSMQALRQHDVEMAKKVIGEDQFVDELSQTIETRCMELLVLQQPMAKDLRLIIAILKIGIDLERVGDMAVDIARIPAQSKNRIGLENVENIYLMGDISRRMLRESIKSLEERDSNLAREITARDYEIDALYVKVRDSLLRFIVRNPDLVGEATNLLMVNRHLERIGDHICNIDESIIYMVEGVREHLN